MKLHIGVDSQTGLVHSAVVTAANVHDKHPIPDLLNGNEQRMYGDSDMGRPSASSSCCLICPTTKTTPSRACFKTA